MSRGPRPAGSSLELQGCEAYKAAGRAPHAAETRPRKGQAKDVLGDRSREPKGGPVRGPRRRGTVGRGLPKAPGAAEPGSSCKGAGGPGGADPADGPPPATFVRSPRTSAAVRAGGSAQSPIFVAQRRPAASAPQNSPAILAPCLGFSPHTPQVVLVSMTS